MKFKPQRFHIGLRTIKTTVAVIIAMIITEALGTTDSKLIFAMLGAMAAVQPTFKESIEACLSQIIGVIFGAVCSILLIATKLSPLAATAIGIVFVITLYNVLQIRYSPSLPCFVVVLLCITPDTQPIIYAAGRIWDTAIGLAIGMAINMLVFPYDNSRKIRESVESLNITLISFLEDMFDGDEVLPDMHIMQKNIDTLESQLNIFSNQKLLLRMRQQHQELEKFRNCEQKARSLIAQMDVLCAMERPGRLNEENRRRLTACGAQIRDERPLDSVTERDVVTNYHVTQILTLRRELLDILQK